MCVCVGGGVKAGGVLSRSNLPPEVKCPGGASYFEVNCPPDTLLSSKLSAQDTSLRRKVTPFEVDCPPCKRHFASK